MLIFLLQVGGTLLAARLYGHNNMQTLECVIVSAVCCGCIFFSQLMLVAEANEIKQIANEYTFAPITQTQFYVLYIVCLIAAMLLPMVDSEGWPFLVIFVMLSLFGDWFAGYVSGVCLLIVSFLLAGEADIHLFIVYLISGLVGCLLFRTMDEKSNFFLQIFVSDLLLFVFLMTCVTLFKEETFHIGMLFLPAVNVTITMILLFVIVKIYTSRVIYRSQAEYMEINDPMYPLLVQLKDTSEKDYYHAVHTAYFCDRIATELGLDVKVVKCAGYYQDIGIIHGNNTWAETLSILQEAEFPEKPLTVIRELTDPGEPLHSKEAAVVLFSNLIVSSVLYLIEKNPNAEINYDNVIEAVFKSRLDNGTLNDNAISISDLRLMKKKFKKEQLYYDNFMRRK